MDLNLVVFGVVVAAVLVLLLFLLLGRLADVELLQSLISVVGLLASIMLVRYWSLSWSLALIVFAVVGGVVWCGSWRIGYLSSCGDVGRQGLDEY
ncbi:MAG: hypothetical protein M3P51_11890 [Chloroflexota bacterium]|nr:hypothetical protein [Chloroflexota bacterium]